MMYKKRSKASKTGYEFNPYVASILEPILPYYDASHQSKDSGLAVGQNLSTCSYARSTGLSSWFVNLA